MPLNARGFEYELCMYLIVDGEINTDVSSLLFPVFQNIQLFLKNVLAQLKNWIVINVIVHCFEDEKSFLRLFTHTTFIHLYYLSSN